MHSQSNTLPVAERFWSHVDRRGDDECWLWTAARSRQGYGLCTVRHGKQRTAHRVAYELVRGSFDEALRVLHRCDNPPCCNPAHLFLGTDADNSDDKVSKSRHPHGVTHGRAKLTEDDVRAIRATYAAEPVSQMTLAALYGVNQTIISDVVLRRSWKHIA